MGLCEVIASLVEALAAAFEERSGAHDLTIQILRLGSFYRDAHRLDAWEDAYCKVLNDDKLSSPVIFELLVAIAQLGSSNMFGRFDVRRTRQEYRRVATLLQSRGVPVPTDLDVSDW